MAHTVALQWVMVLAIGTLLVALCQRIGLSPILGYLVSGILVGPATLGWLADGATVRLLAELGVVLLMFTIGLEFSLPRLLAAKRLVLGGAQVLVTALLFGLVGAWLGLSLTQALVIGVALAMSSTAIVLKQLGEQMELPAPHGRVVTGILLFQDIAVVPVLVVLPILAADSAQLTGALALVLGKAVLVFVGLVAAGRYLLPPILHWVAVTRSQELFMLTALLLAVAAAAVSDLAGLSPTLGAFMAGMLLGETQFRHQLEADIRPFRDLMLGLFFATIGMQLDPGVFVTDPGLIGLVVVALMIVKPLILAPLVKFVGHPGGDACRAALSLAQGGEFGLLMMATGLSLGLIGMSVAQPLLAGLIVSMMFASVLLRFNQPLSAWLFERSAANTALETEACITEASRDFDQHVIICGYGRLGQNVLRILNDEGIDCIVLDIDPERVRQAIAAGEPVMFGNVSRPGILRAAGIDRAQALAITLNDPVTTERIVHQVRGLGLELPVLVRSRHGRDDKALVSSGATVFPEGLESSLAFAGQLLVMLDIPPSQVETRLNIIRAEDYAPLRAFYHATDEEKARQQGLDYPEQIQSVLVSEGHHAAGRTLQELQIEQHGVELLDIHRSAIRVPGRLLDTRVRAGDVLLLKGHREALDIVVVRLTEGA
jgi:CPA2 family monovalent cation:H+ antiporter-2